MIENDWFVRKVVHNDWYGKNNKTNNKKNNKKN
jgi:hypothetical protein